MFIFWAALASGATPTGAQADAMTASEEGGPTSLLVRSVIGGRLNLPEEMDRPFVAVGPRVRCGPGGGFSLVGSRDRAVVRLRQRDLGWGGKARRSAGGVREERIAGTRTSAEFHSFVVGALPFTP